MSERYAYVVIEAEKWWNTRRDQNKAGKEFQAFVRRWGVAPLQAEMLLFYVKNPVRELGGKAEFVERIVGNPEELWNKYGSETVFETYDEYKTFVGEHKTISFIRFKNLRELENPKPLKFLDEKMGDTKWTHWGRYVNKELANVLIS